MNIYEAIRQDHDLQRSLLDQLLETSGDTSTRRTIFSKLKKELQVHADAEERFFYVPLIKKDATQEMARHGVAEHHEIDELVERLEETPFDSPGWLTLCKSLQEQVEHHLADEEKQFFQVSGKVLTESQKIGLAEEYSTYVEKNR
ncbi:MULTISPECIES: hemerythrin domain-containing protein [unclassified Robiginitalea]|uniref:hemerythrin domain-containing protein n=1 Tax=Robiginitalea TaxID=252306 RepID=UPI00234B2AD6|nr:MULTISPECIES: hemerythrin domain-containing protein [unclassified Robiginitalea]MDC6352869.1 hemerythrin domain-containing protein [Robiginitalea sp. PM2]MDC6373964.1 hemerythrin domain-containing protein [Robiginitalea sp. SP8]